MTTSTRILRITTSAVLIVAIALVLAGSRNTGAAATGAATQGDLDCDGGVSTRDNQALLREVLQQSPLSQTQPCTPLGQSVSVSGFGDGAWGDLDCDGEVSTRDNQAELRSVLQQNALSQTEPCPDIGASVTLGEAGPPVTSEDLIAAALEAGEVDYETSLTYRAYALYGDSRLPSAYQTDVFNAHAGSALFKEVEENSATISQATKDALVPFMARPNDPTSIWSQDLAGTDVQAAVGGKEWRSLSTLGGAYRIWRYGTIAEADALLDDYDKDIREIVPELDKIIGEPIPDEPGFPNFDINPDQAIDIYILARLNTDKRHYNCTGAAPYEDQTCYFSMLGQTRDTTPVIGNKSSGYILVQSGWTGAERTHIIAHEMFHLRQNAYDRTEWRGDEEWFIDSTAEWGSFRVLKQLGKDERPVHNWLPPLFYSFENTPLIRGGTWQYRSWLYYYFLELATGDSQVVRKIWEKAAADDQQGAAAINQVAKFDDYFWKFADYDWNDGPHTEYRDGDNIDYKPLLHGQLDPNSQQPTPVTLDGGASKKYETPANAAALTERYFHFDFSDSAVRSGVYHNPIDQEHAHVSALIKVGGSWKEEDWTDEEDVDFCRDKPSENWQELVVIISNSDFDNRAPLNPSETPYLKVTGVGCKNFQGTLTGHVYLNDGLFDITVNDALFIPNPQDTDPTDDVVGYILKNSSNPIIWHASGHWPSASCEISGEMPLLQPDIIADNYAYGSLVITRSTGVYSLFVAGHNFDNTLLTVSCAGSQPYHSMWPVVQPIVWNGPTAPTVADDNGKKVIQGSYTSDGAITGGTWTWDLHEVPPE